MVKSTGCSVGEEQHSDKFISHASSGYLREATDFSMFSQWRHRCFKNRATQTANGCGNRQTSSLVSGKFENH